MANWIWELGYLWWNVIVLSAAKATLLIGVAAVLARMMRSRSPSARCWVWGGALAAAAAMPFVGAMMPSWQVLPQWLDARNLSPSLSGFSDAVSLGELTSPALSWLAGVVAVTWLFGVALLAVRSLLAASLLRYWAKGSETLQPSHRLAIACRDIQDELGIRSTISILHSPRNVVPMTWGLFRTQLLLPRASENWDAIRLRAVLLHELGHVRRRDGLGQILVQWVCACYWFHPMVWWACEQLRYEREAACDDVVLGAGVRATDYAESLLQLSHPLSTAWRTPLTAVAMAEPKALESRIQEILSANRRRSQLPLTHAVIAFGVIAASLLGLSVMTPAETTLPETATAKSGSTGLPNSQALESSQFVEEPVDVDANRFDIDQIGGEDAKSQLGAAPNVADSIRSNRTVKDLIENTQEPSLLRRLNPARAEAMLSDVIGPEESWSDASLLPDSPLRRASPSSRRIRTAGGYHSTGGRPRQRDPLDTRDQVSQASPRSTSRLSSRRPMAL